jgi:hypothetical protein
MISNYLFNSVSDIYPGLQSSPWTSHFPWASLFPTTIVVATGFESTWLVSPYTPIAYGIGVVGILLGGVAILLLLRRVDQLLKATLKIEAVISTARNNSTIKDTNDSNRSTDFTPIKSDPSRVPGPDYHRLPLVVISQRLFPVIHQHVTAFLEKHGKELEAGGVLIGEFTTIDKQAAIKVNGYIESGPKADCSPGSIQFDCEYANRILQATRLQQATATNVGCIHRHPGKMDKCSSGDKDTDQLAVRESESKCLLFGIITLNNRAQDPYAIYHRNFKINFYLMSEETAYEYVPIRPRVEDLPLIEPLPVLLAINEMRNGAAFHDFSVLRRIPGAKKVTAQSVDTEDGKGVLYAIALDNGMGQIRTVCHPSGAIRVFMQSLDGHQTRIDGVWERPEVGKHVWLSHIVLQILAQACSSMPAAVQYGVHQAWFETDKNRLVAEVRVMQEKYGNRAVLNRRGDLLYWSYIVKQSGRELPIQIHYPPLYPNQPPNIISLIDLPSTPHNLDNELCWIDRWSGYNEWSPGRDTAAVCIPAAHRWFACLLVFVTTGRWPDRCDDLLFTNFET